MPDFLTLNITDIARTADIAGQLSYLSEKGEVIELVGDLGAGKTTFARYFINSLCGSDQQVTSPTFNIVQIYDAVNFPIWHFDLYRLKDASELEEIGLYQAFDEALCLIEWPEIIDDILPEDRLLVKIHLENDKRNVVLEGFGKWKEKLGKIRP